MSAISDHFRKLRGEEKLKPGLYVHVEAGLTIKVKRISQDDRGRWGATIEARVINAKGDARPPGDVELWVGDSIDFSFDFEPRDMA